MKENLVVTKSDIDNKLLISCTPSLNSSTDQFCSSDSNSILTTITTEPFSNDLKYNKDFFLNNDLFETPQSAITLTEINVAMAMASETLHEVLDAGGFILLK